MAKVKKIDAFIVNGKTYDSFDKAMIEGTKDDLLKFCNDGLFYDYGKTTSDFIIKNKEKIYDYVKTLINLEEDKKS